MESDQQIQTIKLPPPNIKGSVSVEEALFGRQSVRSFTSNCLSIHEVSQLLWASQGTNKKKNNRTVPSAGATYPIEIFVVVNRVDRLQPGLFCYFPDEHALILRKKGEFGARLKQASLGQTFIEKAAVDIVVTADYKRTTERYGKRGLRYVCIEIGHVGQNIYLQAEALGLGTVAVGAFEDERVKKLLDIDEEVLYIMPVGKK